MTRRRFSLLAPIFILAYQVNASDDGVKISGSGIPPVMRSFDTPDSAIVTLPGPAPEPVLVPPAINAVPAGTPAVAPTGPGAATAAPAPAVTKAPPIAVIRQQAKLEEARPFLRRTKREYPAGFEQDTPKYLQQQIGQWKEFDVADLLGKPLRHRPSFDETAKQNGTIFTFADPTGHYKEFELDFASDTGDLRTVFVYPLKLTWQACRQTYGSKITSADADGGRKFYSYLDRRMDVLVDSSGSVISLGLY